MRASKPILGWCGFMLLMGSAWSQADVPARLEPTRMVFSIPLIETNALPSWLGQPIIPETQFATMEFPLTPPVGEKDLAITFYFDEQKTDLLRVFWQGQNVSEVVCDNLCEGVKLNNRKTVLIPHTLLSGPGVISVQSGSQQLGLWQVQMEWVHAQSIRTGLDAQPPVLFPSTGGAVTQQELSTSTAFQVADHWLDGVISAPLIDKPQRIEEGVIFMTNLESKPALVRLQVKVTGWPLEESLSLQVNGKNAGLVQMSVPDLTDPGYRFDPTGKIEFTGWREGAAWVKADLWTAGENQVQLVQTSDESAVFAFPVAVKDLKLQLSFPAVAPVLTSPSPVNPEIITTP